MTADDSTADRIDLEELSQSLTGFEEIAVERLFDHPFSDLAQSGTKYMRAMRFVELKRTGMNDQDAAQAAMLEPLGQIVGRYVSRDETAPTIPGSRRPEA